MSGYVIGLWGYAISRQHMCDVVQRMFGASKVFVGSICWTSQSLPQGEKLCERLPDETARVFVAVLSCVSQEKRKQRVIEVSFVWQRDVVIEAEVFNCSIV